MSLHPILENSHDEVVRTSTYDPSSQSFDIPGMTVAIFVRNNPISPEEVGKQETQQDTQTEDKPATLESEFPKRNQIILGILISVGLAALTGLWFVMRKSDDRIE